MQNTFTKIFLDIDMSALWNDNMGMTQITSGKQSTLGNYSIGSNTHGRMDWAAK